MTEAGVKVTATVDRPLVRDLGPSTRYLRVELEAPEHARGERRPPVNLGLVLDRSGSMEGRKIEVARQAVDRAIGVLGEEDRFAVVVYDDQVEVVVPSRRATAEARDGARSGVRRIMDRGWTDLCAGWLRGCEQVGLHLDESAVGRCLLLTDGLANRGITDRDEIVRHAAALRERGVSTSTFGVGADFDERLLIRMADAGGGSYHFIEDGDGIMAAVQAEVGETLAVTAREVVVEVEAPPGVEVRSLNEHTVVRGGGRFEVRVGSLYAAQQGEALLELSLPPAPVGTRHGLAVRVTDRDRACPGEPLAVDLVTATGVEVDRQERDLGVARRVAEVLAASAVDAALERNADGDLDGAVRAIRDAVAEIRGWGTDDGEVQAAVQDLESRVDRYSRPLDPMTRKRHSAGSYDVLRSKKPVLRSMFLKRGSAVVLLPTTARLTPLLEEVAARLRTVGSFFAKVRVDDELAVRFGAEPFARATTLRSDLERELRWAVDRVWHEQEAHVRIVFGPWRLGDSWFSHWDDEDGIACVSMAGWDGQFEVSAAAFVAYEVALHGLRAAKNNYDPNALWHKETRGCMFDFCQDRADVEVKLQAFDLCDDCRARLDEWGMPRETLDALADTIRDLATRVPVEARHAGG